MTDPRERRRAERYPHRAHGTLLINQNAYPVHVINISVCGALVAIIDEHDAREEDDMVIEIDSDYGQFQMRGKVAHVRNHYVGLECYPPKAEDEANMKRVIDAINAHALQHN